MKRKKIIYEGQTKTVYETEDADQLILTFKDSILGENGSSELEHKGMVNKRISCILFNYLAGYNIPTHFISDGDKDSIVIRPLGMLPLRIVVHNFANTSIAKKKAIKKGEALKGPFLEFYGKNESNQETILSREEVLDKGFITIDNLNKTERLTFKTNAVLKSFFERRGLLLANIHLKFGHNKKNIVLGGDISLNTCSLWDADTDTDSRFDYESNRSDVEAIQSNIQAISQKILS